MYHYLFYTYKFSVQNYTQSSFFHDSWEISIYNQVKNVHFSFIILNYCSIKRLMFVMTSITWVKQRVQCLVGELCNIWRPPPLWICAQLAKPVFDRVSVWQGFWHGLGHGLSEIIRQVLIYEIIPHNFKMILYRLYTLNKIEHLIVFSMFVYHEFFCGLKHQTISF